MKWGQFCDRCIVYKEEIVTTFYLVVGNNSENSCICRRVVAGGLCFFLDSFLEVVSELQHTGRNMSSLLLIGPQLLSLSLSGLL